MMINLQAHSDPPQGRHFKPEAVSHIQHHNVPRFILPMKHKTITIDSTFILSYLPATDAALIEDHQRLNALASLYPDHEHMRYHAEYIFQANTQCQVLAPLFPLNFAYLAV